MKKIKFFTSLYKERDWLEEMAAQGWLLTNIDLGIIYHFTKTEPCRKVFEIDRFAVSANPTVQELNARKFAIDVASQSGWEVVTHDEDMNYYFMKDKEGDETDEFYDDEILRKDRAERYRKRYAYELPLVLLKESVIFAVLDIILLLFMICTIPNVKATLLVAVAIIFFVIVVFDTFVNYFYLKWGQKIYDELCMSREEWETHKQLGIKKEFKKIQQLTGFLHEQQKKSLALASCDNGAYLFEKDSQDYDYFVDTKACLKARLKKQGVRFKDDEKDLSLVGLKWYETSIADAARYGFTPVGVPGKTAIIYKRPHCEEPVPMDNANKPLRTQTPPALAVLIILGILLAGYGIGYGIGHLAATLFF